MTTEQQKPKSTPSAKWREEGEADPHGNQMQGAEIARMRKALNEAVRVLESARLLCNWPSMNEAIDAAARAGRAALAQEQGAAMTTKTDEQERAAFEGDGE